MDYFQEFRGQRILIQSRYCGSQFQASFGDNNLDDFEPGKVSDLVKNGTLKFLFSMRSAPRRQTWFIMTQNNKSQIYLNSKRNVSLNTATLVHLNSIGTGPVAPSMNIIRTLQPLHLETNLKIPVFLLNQSLKPIYKSVFYLGIRK